MKIFSNFKKNNGQFLVELLVVIGLAAVVLPAILTGFVISRSGRAQHEERLRALELLKEAGEAVRTVREKGWSYVGTNGTYHPVESSGLWTLSSGSESIDGYTRAIAIEDARRLNGEIVEIGGEADPSTKKITLSASWLTPIPASVSEVMYLTRFKNISDITTTVEDFNSGINTNILVTNTSGGELTLGAGGGGDWCSPNLSISAVDLPKQGVANAISAIEGQVISGTGENASGVSFARVNVSSTSPPTGTIVGQYSGFKTNDLFNEQNYSYIATDNNSKEAVILNTQNTPYTEAGYFNAPGNGNGDSIFVDGDIGYVVSGDKLYTFDLSDKSGSRSQLGSFTLNGIGKDIKVVGNYVYVAVDSTATQLQIIKVSNNGSTLTSEGQATLTGLGGVSLFVNSSATRAYVATKASSTQPEMFIVDISTKTGNRPTVNSYNSNGMDPKGITVVPGKAILVGESGEEYQVINISDESSLFSCGGLNVNSGIRGVASILEADGEAYSYIVTGDDSAELKIIEGGPGGQFASAGTFESEIIDASSSVYFNRIFSNYQEPLQTDIRLQAAAADAVGGSCQNADYVFVGPDKTANTYFEGEGLIPSDNDGSGFENPGRCFKFKAFLSTQDPVFSPVIYDVTVNYSP